jgi:outer membrane protein
MKPSRRLRPGPLTLLCAAVIGSWGGAAHAQSLLELYESARGYDASYLSAKLQYDASLASAEQGKAGMRPSANLSAGLSYTDQNLSANSSATAAQAAALQASNRGFQTQSLSASASQPLYRPANRAAYDQALQRAELAKVQLEAAEQELILRTSQAYFDVLAAQDNLTAVQAQRTAVAEQLAAAKRRFEVGTSTIVDTRQAQAAFDRIQAAQIQAENDLAVRRLALDQLVGRAGTRPLPLSTPVLLPAIEGDVNRWVQDAQTQHPSVRGAQTNLEIARLEVVRAQAGHKPTLDATASQSFSQTPNGTASSTVTKRASATVVGLSFNLPLFAGYATENRIKETRFRNPTPARCLASASTSSGVKVTLRIGFSLENPQYLQLFTHSFDKYNGANKRIVFPKFLRVSTLARSANSSSRMDPNIHSSKLSTALDLAKGNPSSGSPGVPLIRPENLSMGSWLKPSAILSPTPPQIPCGPLPLPVETPAPSPQDPPPPQSPC